MKLKDHFGLMATYNQWMNEKIYEAAGRLSAADLAKDRRAFFGSLLGTLNHLVVADILWLKRFAEHPACSISLREVVDLPQPTGLDQIVFDDLERLAERRVWLDQKIIGWIAGLSDEDLDIILTYRNSKGVTFHRRYSSLILHFFNHQTHHRGQASTLLSQAGKDIGVTDLLALIPDEAHV
ncbi:DinB family protein [Salinicola sp. JS01]|uniref:DinB family protein n=1 Tax=Salinicola sp. JS01 TaxID=3050071 RepID=UPI00255B5895|nr:DinB family protein [Salinicola sp. JS01]WIX31815.1 DinB family protein [Salinicola sp. JS01]